MSRATSAGSGSVIGCLCTFGSVASAAGFVVSQPHLTPWPSARRSTEWIRLTELADSPPLPSMRPSRLSCEYQRSRSAVRSRRRGVSPHFGRIRLSSNVRYCGATEGERSGSAWANHFSHSSPTVPPLTAWRPSSISATSLTEGDLGFLLGAPDGLRGVLLLARRRILAHVGADLPRRLPPLPDRPGHARHPATNSNLRWATWMGNSP